MAAISKKLNFRNAGGVKFGFVPSTCRYACSYYADTQYSLAFAKRAGFHSIQRYFDFVDICLFRGERAPSFATGLFSVNVFFNFVF